MESPKTITKAQLLKMFQEEVEFQDRKSLLESKILKINEELSLLSEDTNEGFFQNAKRIVGNAVSGAKQVGKGMVQNYQQGADQNKLQNITADIQAKTKELSDLKNQYKYLTGQAHNAKVAPKATAVNRTQQGVVKSPIVKPVANQTAKPIVQQAVKPQRNQPVIQKQINPRTIKAVK